MLLTKYLPTLLVQRLLHLPNYVAKIKKLIQRVLRDLILLSESAVPLIKQIHWIQEVLRIPEIAAIHVRLILVCVVCSKAFHTSEYKFIIRINF